MTPERTPETNPPPLTSRAFEITVDGGRDSFRALSIERADRDGEWIISDTVLALENMQ